MKAIDKDAFSYSLQSDSLMDHRIVFSKERKETKPKTSEIASCQVNAFRAYNRACLQVEKTHDVTSKEEAKFLSAKLVYVWINVAHIRFSSDMDEHKYIMNNLLAYL